MGREVSESCIDSLVTEMVSSYCNCFYANKPDLAARRIEAIGYQVGHQLSERYTMERPRFSDHLEAIKFICKDFWFEVFKKQIDNLKTNHRGTFVLQDDRFRWLARMSADPSMENGGLPEDPSAVAENKAALAMSMFLYFPCGIIQGALSNLGIPCAVSADISNVPAFLPSLEKKEKDGTAQLIEEQLQVLNLKEKEHGGIQKLINEKSEDLGLKEKLLDSIKELIKENTEELEIKEKQQEAMKASIVVRSADLKVKEADLDLDLIEKSIKKRQTELRSVHKQLNSFQRSKDQLAKELESKEEELKSVKKKLRLYNEHLKLKEADLHACEIAMKEPVQNPNTKEKLLTSVQTSIEECSKELNKMKEQHNLVKKSIVESSEELKSEEKNLGLARNSVKECCYQLESRKAQLESIQRTSCKLSKGLEEKERQFDSLKMAFQEHLEEFQVKATQFEERVKDFKLKEKQFDSMKRTIEENVKEVELKQKLLNDSLHLRVVLKQHENSSADTNSMSVSLQCCIPSDGANLQLILNQHLMVHDLVPNEVRTAIQSSSEPAKMVLDAMQGFYPPSLNSRNVKFGINIIRRSCITLLKLLFNISPMIESQVRGEAMKLAVEWRAKIWAMPENPLEVLGFLQLLAAFKLVSAFSAIELQSLLDTIKERGQDPELRQGLGITDNLAGSMSPVCSSSANLQSNANSTEGILQPVQFDCVGELPSAHHEIFAALMFSSDPAKLVLNVMRGFPKYENTSFDASSLSSKVFLLEQVMAISPDISPCLKEEALGLALLWEAKMRSETKNSMEVLGFLLFLAIYGLAPHFKRDQIFGLIEIVLEHKKAAEICQVLGLVDVPAGCMQILPVSGCTDQPQLHGRIDPPSSPVQGDQNASQVEQFSRPHQTMP